VVRSYALRRWHVVAMVGMDVYLYIERWIDKLVDR